MTIFERLWRPFSDVVLARIRVLGSRALERGAPALAARLFATGDSVAKLPFKTEPVTLPPALSVNGARVDVASDLAAFTGLSRDAVQRELEARSFRSEWHATPDDLRVDHWYYLSAKGYLFANAIHFPDLAFVDEFVRPHVPAPARVLDFGAGTGNLSLTLVAAGYRVAVSELNALQRDFIRFRVDRHALADEVDVLDWWGDLPRGEFDAIVAVDVLEHLENAAQVLDDQLLPALKPGGVLIENSPFVVNAANPMHHEDFGLTSHLEAHGLVMLASGDDGTRVWAAPR